MRQVPEIFFEKNLPKTDGLCWPLFSEKTLSNFTQNLLEMKNACLFLALFLMISCQNRGRVFEKKETGKGPEPNDWFFAQRAFPLGFVPRESYREAQKQAAFFRKNNSIDRGGAGWQLAGPTNMGGRISTIAAHPAEPETVYVGAANGGIFKTTDGGDSFTQIFDDFPSVSMGDIAIAPSNKNKIYVGTGEANGGGGSMSFDGLGLWKSGDAGQNWQPIGLENIASVGKIVVDPTDENRLFVAGMGDLYGNDPERGIFRSLDGGATWVKSLFVNDSTGGIDLAMNPADPNIVFAATFQRIRRPDRRQYGGPGSGIYRTKNGGDTWQKLTTGLPTTSHGRIGIAVAPSQPDTVYAVLSAENGAFKGFYRSKNGGDTWSAVFTGMMPGSFYSNFGWWFGKIWVDPADANHVFSAGIEFFESKNGGASWQNISGFGNGEMHVDHHAFWQNPADPGQFYVGNDGGFYRTFDGGNFYEKMNTLPISQFYATTMDFQNPEKIYGGAQDNGTWRATSGGLDDWEPIFGGDGFFSQVDPTDDQTIYAESQYGYLGRSDNGGFFFQIISENGIDPNARTNWSTPILLHPNDPNQLFYGAEKLWFSGDRGDSWGEISPDLTGGQPGNLPFGTITAIAVSPVDGQTIWCGTDDGRVWVSPDFGQNWQDISAGLPGRWITRVTASPTDAATAYLTVSGYRWNEPLPHVFKTTDLGQNWQNISSNLPEAPMNDILVDPANPATLWAAGDMGVFTSNDDGGSWELLASGLPNVPVTDLEFHVPTRKLVAATFGRSMYSIDLQGVSSKNPREEHVSMEILGNPFLEKSQVDFLMKKPGPARFDLFEISGKWLKTIAAQDFPAGKNSLFLSKNELPGPGVFILKMQTATGSCSRKLVRM